MVLLHMKQGEDRQFLFEVPASDCVDDVVRELVMVHNLQLRISHLVEEGKQLAQYGPMKEPGQEYDSDDEDSNGASSSSVKGRGPFYKKDPAGRRTGEACDPAVAETLMKTLADAENAISKNQIQYKVALTATMLKEVIQNIKGAVMMCYPMGIPKYDPVQQELNGSFEGKESMNPATAQLWWAGKEIMRDKKLSDYVGRNDKTKIVARIQEKGRGAPQREPPIDAETQKAMMSWYYKKQQEQKALNDDQDDNYTNAAWANPKSLKSHFHGTANIKYR